MTRSELVAQIYARSHGLKEQDCKLAVDTLLGAIAATLIGGGRAEIRGFGSFSTHIRPPRNGRNPLTGEPVPVPAKCVPHFKPSKALTREVPQLRHHSGTEVIANITDESLSIDSDWTQLPSRGRKAA